MFGFSTPEKSDGENSRVNISKTVPSLNCVHTLNANFQKGHSYFHPNTRWLMLFREMFGVYCENDTQYKYSVWQYVDFLIVEADGMCIDQ
jgi:hypothetical protein